jgi:16S rRNA (cytosine1402-N4)-methyltransferase
MVDATVGHGGHSFLFGRTLGRAGAVLGLDIDSLSLERARQRLAGLGCRVILIKSNFSSLAECLDETGIGKVDLILADLGFSSAQLADAEMGLSFRGEDMPLDMRIDESLETTAADIVNGYDEKALADLIYQYGEDRASRRIARFIVRRRQHERITTTGHLAEIVCGALKRPGTKPKAKKHPAARTFQALRIAVNHELDNLRTLLVSSPGLLKKDGVLAVISFHSLEDRLVKWDFKEKQQGGIYRVLTKKPIVADRQEVLANRRARSAKLRIAQRN